MRKSLAYLLSQACRMVCVWGLVCGAMCGLSACGWQEAKEVIAWADSIDQKEHMIYDDTIALSKAIRCLDNPLGRVIMSNTLGKAYYYMGRNYSLSNQIAEAADCYIEADRLQIDDPIYRGRVNSCIGYICAQNNNDSLALVFYEHATNNFRESGHSWRYAQSLLNIIPCYIIYSPKRKVRFLQNERCNKISKAANSYHESLLLFLMLEQRSNIIQKALKKSENLLIFFAKKLVYVRFFLYLCSVFEKVFFYTITQSNVVGLFWYIPS